jgi:hypothetical protein
MKMPQTKLLVGNTTSIHSFSQTFFLSVSEASKSLRKEKGKILEIFPKIGKTQTNSHFFVIELPNQPINDLKCR